MREIKFRARSAAVPRCWIYGYFIIDRGSHYIINDDGQFQVICDTEGQFTGIKDKNGKEIYEGDIVKMLSRNLSQVYFRDSGFCVDVGGELVGLHPDFLGRYRTVEVIGNIHENPELLKGKSKEG